MPPAPSRPPADVAHRLAVLAAHRAASTPDPRVGSVVAPAGWTPRAPAAGPAAVRGGAAGPPDDEPDVPGPARPDAAPDAPRIDPPDAPRDDGPDAPHAVPPDGPWDPSVVSALAHAAASLPPTASRTRWVPGWRAAGAAALVLALAAGGVALRASSAPRGEPVVVPTPAVDVRAGVDGDPGPSAERDGAGDPAQQVVVHVVGAVASPGVVQLALGARVADALEAAGGTLPDAETGAVNLARVLVDGEQLVVPVVGATPPAAAAAPADDGLVDLNGADAVALQELPGVGPVLAERIVERRDERPFTTVDELDEVTGIGPALMERLRPRVRV